MTAIIADISLEGLLLNDRMFRAPALPHEYMRALNSPLRVIDPSPPAPYGHRNNQIHMFDELGLYLIEHHATGLVDSVEFVLWQDEAAFKPAREYSGTLKVGGVSFFPGITPSDHWQGAIEFAGPVLRLWSAEKDGVWIGLSVEKMRQPSGRRGKRLRFANVSVCFSRDANR